MYNYIFFLKKYDAKIILLIILSIIRLIVFPIYMDTDYTNICVDKFYI